VFVCLEYEESDTYTSSYSYLESMKRVGVKRVSVSVCVS